MLSSMDHLFCLRVLHVPVPASLRDLHRHSCRHFHFHFWLSLLPLLCLTVDIIFKSSVVSRASPLCVSAFLHSRLFYFLFFSLSFFLFFPLFASFFLSSLARLCDAHFLLLRARWNMRARVKHGAFVSLLFDFPRVLRPCDLLEARPPARRDGAKGGREDFLDRAEGDRWAPHREIERRARCEKGARRRNVKFRELIRSVGVSEVARRAFKGPAAVFIELAKVNLLASRKLGHRHCAAWSKQDKQPLHDLEKKTHWKKNDPNQNPLQNLHLTERVTFKSVLNIILLIYLIMIKRLDITVTRGKKYILNIFFYRPFLLKSKLIERLYQF